MAAETPAVPASPVNGHAPPAPAATGGFSVDLAHLIDTIPHITWAADPLGRLTWVNARFHDFIGDVAGDGLGDRWMSAIHPEDRAATRAAWTASLAAGAEHRIEHRALMRSGRYHWFASRGVPVRDTAGVVVGWYGTATDIQAEKQAAEALALVSRELVHRIKNIFAVVSSLIRFTFRGNAAAREAADTLQQRLAALAAAHAEVRPETGSERATARLVALLHSLVDPYRVAGLDRVRITGDDVCIGPRAAASLALTLHEQATNAVKYGALSTLTGSVGIDVRAGAEDVTIVWTERDGPPVAGPPTRRGFGTDLAARTVADQLQGRMTHDWRPDGLALTISVSRAALAD